MKRKKEDYPTMNDVMSDWDSKDGEEMLDNNKNAKKDNNKNIDGGEAVAAAKKAEEEEMKLRKQEDEASEKKPKKKKVSDDEKLKQQQKQEALMEPENLLKKINKVEEDRVKKIRANKPSPKPLKRNTKEVMNKISGNR